MEYSETWRAWKIANENTQKARKRWKAKTRKARKATKRWKTAVAIAREAAVVEAQKAVGAARLAEAAELEEILELAEAWLEAAELAITDLVLRINETVEARERWKAAIAGMQEAQEVQKRIAALEMKEIVEPAEDWRNAAEGDEFQEALKVEAANTRALEELKILKALEAWEAEALKAWGTFVHQGNRI